MVALRGCSAEMITYLSERQKSLDVSTSLGWKPTTVVQTPWIKELALSEIKKEAGCHCTESMGLYLKLPRVRLLQGLPDLCNYIQIGIWISKETNPGDLEGVCVHTDMDQNHIGSEPKGHKSTYPYISLYLEQEKK